MIDRLRQNKNQLLAVAMLAAAVACLFTLTIVPIWSANAELQARIDAADQALRSLRADADAGERLKPRLEQLKRRQLSAGYYLASNTGAVAAADLQGLINRIAGASGADILSTQILPTGEEAGFPRVSLRVRMRATYPALIETFHAIESNSTFLFMDNVAVRTMSRRRGSRQNDGAQFDTDFDLIAYMPAEADDENT